MRHKFLVLTVKKWLKSVYISGEVIANRGAAFLDHSVHYTVTMKVCIRAPFDAVYFHLRACHL